jgi:WD40 repeat protein
LPDGGIRVWDLESKKSSDLSRQERSTVGSTSFTAIIRSHGIYKPWTAISPDGKGLLTGIGNDSMLWWNLDDLSETPLRLEGKDALFSRNGNVLVTLLDRSIKVWTPKGRSLKGEMAVEGTIGFLSPLALSDDGNTLALGSDPLTETENAIRLLDTRGGKLLGVCKGHTQGVRWLAFSPDGETLASVSDDSTLRFWNVDTQQELLSIRRLAEPIREILFSPDGNWLVAKTTGGLRLLDGTRDHATSKPATAGHSAAGP